MIFLVILLLIISILVLIYFIGLNKFKDYNMKMVNAEKIINNSLKKKQDIIIDMNTNIKKLDSKKDYLKDYIELKDKKINNIEKDLKLEEATKLINDLKRDYSKLSKDNDFNKKLQSLREIDEKLVSAKSIYNNNAILNNRLIRIIPYNIIGKISGYTTVTFYNNKNTNEDDA